MHIFLKKFVANKSYRKNRPNDWVRFDLKYWFMCLWFFYFRGINSRTLCIFCLFFFLAKTNIHNLGIFQLDMNFWFIASCVHICLANEHRKPHKPMIENFGDKFFLFYKICVFWRNNSLYSVTLKFININSSSWKYNF